MYQSKTIAGYEVHMETSKQGQPRSAVVMVGDPNKPSLRAKDGSMARKLRKIARVAVAEALGLPLSKVRAQARYTSLHKRDDGLVERRDSSGRVIGVHLP